MTVCAIAALGFFASMATLTCAVLPSLGMARIWIFFSSVVSGQIFVLIMSLAKIMSFTTIPESSGQTYVFVPAYVCAFTRCVCKKAHSHHTLVQVAVRTKNYKYNTNHKIALVWYKFSEIF